MHTVTITSQGQITIPAKIRRQLGFDKIKKAVVSEQNGKLFIEPAKDILNLRGSLKTKIKASPRQIRKAFEKHLAQEAVNGIR